MKVKQIIKCLLYFMIFLLSWYFVTGWRTTEFGVSINSIGGQIITAFISIFPLSLVALLFLILARYNLHVKKFVVQILIIAVLVIVISEIWASSEEYLFKKKCTENTSDVTHVVWQVRWWPFTNNTLGYHKGVFFAQE